MTLRVLLVFAMLLTSAVPTGAAESDGALIARALPRLVHRGGPFLRHPRIVTVTFAGDDAALVGRLVRFGDVITRSTWWRTVTEGLCTAAGDCIGDGRPGRNVVLERTLPSVVHATDVAALLHDAVAADGLGALDAETLLLVYLPAGVALTDAFVPRYCGGAPRGFHGALRRPDRLLAYAVVPRCGDEADLTATASHEILEATANPDPSARGFAFAGGSTTAGFAAAGAEPVDPCGLLTRDRHRTIASGFTVQRAWSNAAAARGMDPCAPAVRSAPFLAAVPEQPAVRLRAPGDQATLTLTAAASHACGSWSLDVVDLAGGHAVDVVLDRTRVVAGETVTLTLTARATPPGGRGLVAVRSTAGATSHLWPIAVTLH